MKVTIGKYKNWFGPYQLADLLQYVGFSEDFCYDLGGKLSKTFINDILKYIHSKRKRSIKIHIDNYDVWDADHTLSMIIHPVLLMLKEHKHGAPFVDDEDVPDNIKSINSDMVKEEGIDSNFFNRWDYVLNEMIFAFGELSKDDYEEPFHSGEIDIIFEDDADGSSRLKNGPNHTHTFDKEGYDKHMERIQNGLRLFAKYYLNLWD